RPGCRRPRRRRDAAGPRAGRGARRGGQGGGGVGDRHGWPRPRRPRRSARLGTRVYAAPVQELIDELGRLPGIGPKSAQRIAFHLLKMSPEDALRLATAISAVQESIRLCTRCFRVCDGEVYDLCTANRRDTALLTV